MKIKPVSGQSSPCRHVAVTLTLKANHSHYVEKTKLSQHIKYPSTNASTIISSTYTQQTVHNLHLQTRVDTFIVNKSIGLSCVAKPTIKWEMFYETRCSQTTASADAAMTSILTFLHYILPLCTVSRMCEHVFCRDAPPCSIHCSRGM